MKRSVAYTTAVMLLTGTALGFWARSYTTGIYPSNQEAGILTPARDEAIVSLEESDIIISDERVPLAAGPGALGGDNAQPVIQESPYIRQIVTLVNEERTKAGLMPLEKSDEVSSAAAVRAKELTFSFSHTRPDGSAYRTVLEQTGISYRSCGENVAYVYSTPEAVMSAWMTSEGHRDNILNEGYTNIGVGYFKDSSGLGYWAQIFTIKK